MFHKLPIYCPDCKQLMSDCECGFFTFKNGDTFSIQYNLNDYLDTFDYDNNINWSNVEIIVQRYIENPNIAPMTLQEYFDQFKDDE